jgi:hypothetical protein
VPALLGARDEDAVAVLGDAALSATGLPGKEVPPLAQPVGLANGPQTKKLTVPVGTPRSDGSATVAVSVADPPRVRALGDGTDVVVLAVAAKTGPGKIRANATADPRQRRPRGQTSDSSSTAPVTQAHDARARKSR